jgi:hypothetical protein
MIILIRGRRFVIAKRVAEKRRRRAEIVGLLLADLYLV